MGVEQRGDPRFRIVVEAVRRRRDHDRLGVGCHPF